MAMYVMCVMSSSLNSIYDFCFFQKNYVVGLTLATPNAEMNTFITVTKNIPITVKLFILFAIQISFLSLTLYREFQIKPTPTAT